MYWGIKIVLILKRFDVLKQVDLFALKHETFRIISYIFKLTEINDSLLNKASETVNTAPKIVSSFSLCMYEFAKLLHSIIASHLEKWILSIAAFPHQKSI